MAESATKTLREPARRSYLFVRDGSGTVGELEGATKNCVRNNVVSLFSVPLRGLQEIIASTDKADHRRTATAVI
jgi:hypothetical protein